MKKILVLLIAFTLMFSLTCCGDDGEDGLTVIKNAFSATAPTMVVTETTQVQGNLTLNGKYTLTVGKVDGQNATQYLAVYDKLNTIEDGAGTTIKPPVVEVTESREYVADKGVRENGGKWNKKGDDFAPEAGSYALNLTESAVLGYTFENNVFSCIIVAEDTETVFGKGNAIPVDVTLEIVTDGVVITAVNMSYTIEAVDEYPEVTVTVKTTYSYDVQSITLVK